MRISDWSSDVCSSDLLGGTCAGGAVHNELRACGELTEAIGQLGDGDVHRGGDLPGLVLVGVADVEHEGRIFRTDAGGEVGGGDLSVHVTVLLRSGRLERWYPWGYGTATPMGITTVRRKAST